MYQARGRASLKRHVLAGTDEVDLELALEKVTARFGVRTLMLEGGGRVNGAFLRAALVDEVSRLVVPAVDGRAGAPAVFDADGEIAPHRFALMAMQRLDNDLLWIRYQVESAGCDLAVS